ncbi:unnamed protein product [Tilletia laevis]|uniref:Uncharacterized protein n=2 Tax=Tilletia TaxID=13289 RepID=A0A177V1M2_9BASI|nr:hypothetical protein CF336_g1042 [Tilletia laevis]KAE8262614.1 hypothetical protein A4X03_0g2316 [Tilletia caries]KAE8205938.1 hypothetical protein CF335_g2135 [Tilletia laevis]CAD6893779.1 unnamed protein product [Tilletia caries]CAD6917213.1 unnamed protein product [Tilletia laevis]
MARMTAPPFEIMAGEPSRILTGSTSLAQRQSSSPASYLTPAFARLPHLGTPQRAKMSSEPLPGTSFGDGNPLLATASANPPAQSSTSYPVRLARAAVARRSAPTSSQPGHAGNSGDGGDNDFLLYGDHDDTDDDDDEEDDERQERETSDHHKDTGAGSASRLGGNRNRDGGLSHRNRQRPGRRRRGGIPLDEQRAAPPPPVSTSSFSSDHSHSRGLPSPPAQHRLNTISFHSHSASPTSFGSTGPGGHPGFMAVDPNYPLPETTNALGKTERRTQVRRTQKLAQMLGGEVLADEDRREWISTTPSSSPRGHHTLAPSAAAAALGSASKDERGKATYAGETFSPGGRRASDSVQGAAGQRMTVLGSGSDLRAASTGVNVRPTSMYAVLGASNRHQRQDRSTISALSVPSASGSSATGLSSKVAKLDVVPASDLRRRSPSPNRTGGRSIDGQQSVYVHESQSPLSGSIQGNNLRRSSAYDSRDITPPFRTSGSQRLTMRRSLESIRTTMTTSTFAESTLSSLDEAALERRAQAEQREERRRKVAKMSRWLGVAVPAELLTSPGLGPPTPQASRAGGEDTSPRLLNPPHNRSDWMSSVGSGSSTGIGAALHVMTPSDEVRNKMARVGKFMKLGGPSPPSPAHTGFTNTAGSGANLAALDLSGASSSSAAYKHLHPLDLNLSNSFLHRARTMTSGSPNTNTPEDDSTRTPVERGNALSTRERIANVKRASKLERVFGEAPPHVLFSVGNAAGTNSRSVDSQTSSEPVTPRWGGPRSGDVSSSSVQAALDDLVVSLPSSSANASANPHHPYGASIMSSPHSFRSAYRQSLDSLEYLLDNDLPLLNEMMTALDEDDGSTTPLNSTPASKRPSMEILASTESIESPAPPQQQQPPSAARPKSPGTPGHRRYHSMASPVFAGLERMTVFDPNDIPDAQSPKGQAIVSASSVDSGMYAGAGGRRRPERAEDLSQMSPLQLAPWDLHDASSSSALRPAFWAGGERSGQSDSRGSLVRSSSDQAVPTAMTPESGSNSPRLAGGSGSGPASAVSLSRRASLISHLSRISTTPSLLTLNSMSPPGSPRDSVSAEHELRRQRALRAQKLGRFFGAAPNTMPYTSAAGVMVGAEGAGAGRGVEGQHGGTMDRAEAVACSSAGGLALNTSNVRSHLSPESSSSSAVSTAATTAASTVRVRRLAPRSAGSATPHNSFMRMLRSLEEEAMEDETLSAVERKEIRDRLNAMRRRGEEGDSSMLTEEMAVL